MERKVIIIAGPTCSGKTALSLLLAEKLNTEIISADSRQFYKYLDIGTAKPTREQQEKIKHHFIDNLNPGDYFNASMFEKKSLEIIESLHALNKVPIITGGSGLYIKALEEGIFDSSDQDEELRAKLISKKETEGVESLYKELEKIDPVSAKTMLPQNWKRVIRALEVFYTTKKTIWQHHAEQKRNSNLIFSTYALDWPREILYQNIESRVDKMISSGLIDEVKNLLASGYDKNLNSLNTVGYKEIISYLDGEINLDRAVELIKRNTRRYAKRQLTWFRNNPQVKWYPISSINELENIANKIILSEGLNEREN